MTKPVSALRAIYLRQRAALIRFLTRRTNDPLLAEDITQEVWLRLDQMGCVALRNPEAYLFRIATNLANDYGRAEKNRRLSREQIDETLTIEDGGPNPEQVAIDRSELRRLFDAIEKLPERQRCILLMSRLDKRTHKEIAGHFGISTRTVEFELKRALGFCLATLKK